ncbi:MAG: hypothetical protein ABI865_12970 [Nitrosospira sp.]
MRRIVILILALFGIVGCARHVVVNPDEVSRYNSPDWVVKSAPAKSAADTKTK